MAKRQRGQIKMNEAEPARGVLLGGKAEMECDDGRFTVMSIGTARGQDAGDPCRRAKGKAETPAEFDAPPTYLLRTWRNTQLPETCNRWSLRGCSTREASVAGVTT